MTRRHVPVIGAAAPAPTDLTPREKQVVDLLCRAFTHRAIARELGLTYSTVNTYTKRIYAKTGVHTSLELVVRTLELELQDLRAELERLRGAS